MPKDLESRELTVQSEAEMRKLALTSLAGTSIKWLDFFIWDRCGTGVSSSLFPKICLATSA